MKQMLCSRGKHARVLLSFFSIAFLSSACGIGDTDEKDANEGLIFTTEYDPASYYTFIEECSQGLKGGSETSYNALGNVISEKVCVADSAAKILKITEKRLVGTTLEVRSYAETTYNDDGRPLAVKEWRNTEKSELVTEYSFTYTGGKLVQSIYKSVLGDTVATTDYNDLEEPVKETTIAQFGGSTTTTVSTCLFLRDYQPCEKTKDGQVRESIEKVGEEFIRKELVNDSLIETERFSFLDGNLGLYKKQVRKSYSFDGTISYEEEESCTLAGSEATCSETRKTPAGKTFYKHDSTYRNVGKVKAIIGGVVKESDAFIEVAGTLTALTEDKEYSGSFSATFDTATLNSDSDIKIDVKASAHPDLESVFIFLPYWGQNSSDLNKIFGDTVTTGSASFKSIARYNAQKEPVLNEVTTLIGLTPEQIGADFVYKKVSTYE